MVMNFMKSRLLSSAILRLLSPSGHSWPLSSCKISQGLSFQAGEEPGLYLTPVLMKKTGIPVSATVFPEETALEEISSFDTL
jgi:hypothetical protein